MRFEKILGPPSNWVMGMYQDLGRKLIPDSTFCFILTKKKLPLAQNIVLLNDLTNFLECD